MVRPLTGLAVGVVFLIMIGTAFGQGYYGGNNYPGAYQYDPYSQAYGNPGYGEQGAYPGYGQQYGYPGYGQQGAPTQSGYNPQGSYGYSQNQQGAAPYQNYQNYPGYSDYMNAMQQAYNPAAVNENYQGYGTPGGVYQPQGRYAPVQRRQARRVSAPRQTTQIVREEASRSDSDPNFAAEVEEDTLLAKEIYWDPNADPETSENESVRSRRETASPSVRPRVTSSRPTVESPRPRRSSVRARSRSSVPAPPSSSRSLSWGRTQKKEQIATKPKPESRRSFKWGKEGKPSMVTSEPGSSSVRSEGSLPVGQQVKVEQRAPARKYQWGKSN